MYINICFMNNVELFELYKLIQMNVAVQHSISRWCCSGRFHPSILGCKCLPCWELDLKY